MGTAKMSVYGVWYGICLSPSNDLKVLNDLKDLND